ncbi:hypothetical protein GCM10009676_28100 [Prauserella halophila]|uniref:Uncharacterized protein n=1 Tax=Prauserella halophila TaxID=185641 RepID=A0ABP4H026_9PSEU|nr:hypothetical protein [Prauserella halophila]MCP2236871.1 hypothetical protein [Prauserella halophila]
MSDDPERLLAEALRAQARNAPPAGHPAPQHAGPDPQHASVDPRHAGPDPEPSGPAPVVETPGGYGLLSGAGEGSLERERAALDAQAAPSAPSAPSTPTAEPALDSATEPAVTRTSGHGRHQRTDSAGRSVSLPWIVLLAAVLGLACGCVIGLLTIT